MTGIDLYPISKFMGNSEGEKPFKFIIPNYQRGYRWGKEQVEELLSDLCEFYQDTTKNPKEIYCMQPLVVCEKTDTNENREEETSYVVVDGQQRLTTLYILFRTISEIDKKDVFTISYDSRPESKDYLNDGLFLELHTFAILPIWLSGQNSHLLQSQNHRIHPSACNTYICIHSLH